MIEPSEICLKRATLHVSKFCPDAEIVTVNKEFDDLSNNDIACDEEIPSLHILSNVLDLEFDLGNFAQVINDNLKGYNQFVCVGPYFNMPSIDRLMDDFAGFFFEGKDNFNKIFDKYQLNPDKSWTGHIRCFSVGELEEDLSTEVTEEDLKNGIEDEFGVVYSRDGKRLLKCNRWYLLEYTIKEGTKVICDKAFNNYDNNSKPGPQLHFNPTIYLHTIVIPNTVVCIGDAAFFGCSYLKNINLPNSLVHIGNSAFMGCRSLQELSVPFSTNYLGKQSYANCCSLMRITISNPNIQIEERCFEHCDSIEQIMIPKGYLNNFTNQLHKDLLQYLVENINTQATGDGIIDNLVRYSKNGEILFNYTRVDFAGYYSDHGIKLMKSKYKGLTNYNIKKGTKIVCDEAFKFSPSLKKIVFPNTVTHIGNSVFEDCPELLSVTISESVAFIGESIFEGCDSLQEIKVIDNKIFKIQNNMLIDTKRQKVLSYFGKEINVVIPDGIKTIGNSAFYGKKSIRRLTLPKSIKNIGKKAFCCCESLYEIVVPEYSIVNIEESAFASCKHLEKIQIPNSVINIDRDAFSVCLSLKHIQIPYCTKHIGINAFTTCESLISVYITDDSICIIDRYTFSGCKSLKYINLPKGLKVIKERAFINCETLEDIVMPYSIEDIAFNAFEDCFWLKHLLFEGSIKRLSESFLLNNRDNIYSCGKCDVVKIVKERQKEISFSANNTDDLPF